MVILDLFIIVFFVIIIFLSFKAGFIEALGSLLGLILGAIIASRAAEYLGDNSISKVFIFVLVFLLVGKFIGMIFYLIGKFFKIFSVIPFFKTFNRTLGGLLGILEAILISGVILFFLTQYPVSNWIIDQISRSFFSGHIIYLASFLFPVFFPSFHALLPEIKTYRI